MRNTRADGELYDGVNSKEGQNNTGTDKGRQLLIREKRTANEKQFDEGIFVHQNSTFGMGVTAGNLFSGGGGTLISIGKVGTHTVAASIADSANSKDIANAVNALNGTGTTK